ncbi:MAG: hypothetical protein [Bacteriophage sp.]|nr:MAG: hypothetical protein [Bacteriophage sp.]
MILNWYYIRYYRQMQNYRALVVAYCKEDALELLREVAALTDIEHTNATCTQVDQASRVDNPRVVSIVQ